MVVWGVYEILDWPVLIGKVLSLPLVAICGFLLSKFSKLDLGALAFLEKNHYNLRHRVMTVA